MTEQKDSAGSRATWTAVAIGAARVTFGVIWAVDAYLAWRPEFAAHYFGYLQNASNGQPSWLKWWFAMWLAVVAAATPLFVWLTRLVETLLAVALLSGFARKTTYRVGALFSLLVWATGEGFSGPYVLGAANLGPALVYVLVFGALLLCDRVAGRTRYSVDYYLEKRWTSWRRVSESATDESLAREPPPSLPWSRQGVAVVGIAVVIAIVIGGLQSALAVPAATPMNAAAAVSPLSLCSPTPEATARDAHLPLSSDRATAFRSCSRPPTRP